MPSRRLLLTCAVLSVLLHILVLVLAYLYPSVLPRPEDVMVVDLADIPRSTDFLPPRPGALEGRRPTPALPKAPSPETKPGASGGADPRGAGPGPPREAGPPAREDVFAFQAAGGAPGGGEGVRRSRREGRSGPPGQG